MTTEPGGDPIVRLPRVVPAPPGKPVRAGAERARQRAHRLATRPRTWDQAEALAMRAEYDQSAAEWDRDRGDYRPPVLADALARGGPFPAGPAVEIASGTGLLTPLIAAVWPQLLAIDLSHGMLRRGAAKGPAAVHRVQADAARLPLPGGSVAAVIIGDGPLFAPELARIMTAGAVLVWSNALGADAPFHVKAPVLLQTMTAATGRTWRAVTSEAWWGSWVILRS